MTTKEQEDATAAPLLARLNALFESDPLIDEIGLLFDVAREDLTPASAFAYGEHKLGVAFCAGVPLFQQARTRFHQLNPQLAALRATEERGDVDNAVVRELLQCTRAILLISADFYSAWNSRKAMVELGVLDAQDEVRFTNLVFTLHPKSIDTWAYRRWLAIRICRRFSTPPSQVRDIFFNEQVHVCSVLAEQKPRNYHAWSFRHWVVSRFTTETELRRELERMTKWCETHITDHSGWNHREHTVNHLLRVASTEDRLPVIVSEYAFLSRIMARYPTHEALWCHRRFIIHHLFRHFQDQSSGQPGADVCKRIYQIALRVKTDAHTTSPMASSHPPESSDTIGMDLAALSSAWMAIEADLSCLTSSATPSHLQGSETVISTLVGEIEIAWLCECKYSRRFTVWCLERLRAWSKADRNLQDVLNRLSSSCRSLLAREDPTLAHLWMSKQLD